MMSQDEKQRMAEQNKARYQYLKARGRCVTCGEMDAYTLAGRVRCAGCFEKEMQYHERYAGVEENHKKIRATAKRRYEERKAAGLCTKCGKKPPEEGKTKCKRCLMEDAKNHRKSSGSMSRDTAKWIGICTLCLKQKALPDRCYCELCYKKSVASIAYARTFIDRKNVSPLLFGRWTET